MRGDSLRDLYAKTLAVIGLGLLAAAGAIVDYWPVSGQLPVIPSVATLRDNRPAVTPPPLSEISAPRVIRAAYHAQTDARSTARAFVTSFHSVSFVEPVVAVEGVNAPVPELDLASRQSDWSSALWSMTAIDLDLQPPPAYVANGPTGHGRPLLTGAVSALKKTRASIREAFRGVVGTFRKVSPFWDATATPSFR